MYVRGMKNFVRSALGLMTFAGATIAIMVGAVAMFSANTPRVQPAKVTDSYEIPPMTFQMATNGSALTGEAARWVAATGSITDDTPAAFEAFVAANSIENLTIFFHSYGGSFRGGIELGKLLRKHKASVAVGHSMPISSYDTNQVQPTVALHHLSPADGYCFSACSIAFLGGLKRTVSNYAYFGSHMFWQTKALKDRATNIYSAQDVELTQKVSAELALYLETMDVSQQFLAISAEVAPEGKRRFTSKEIGDLDIARRNFELPRAVPGGGWGLITDTNGTTYTVASTMTTLPRGVDLRHRILLFCLPGQEYVAWHVQTIASEPKDQRPVQVRNPVLLANGKPYKLTLKLNVPGKPAETELPDKASARVRRNLTTIGNIEAGFKEISKAGTITSLAMQYQNEADEMITVDFPLRDFSDRLTEWHKSCGR